MNVELEYPWHQAAWQSINAYFCGDHRGLAQPNALLCSGVKGLAKRAFIDRVIAKLYCANNQKPKDKGVGAKRTLEPPCGQCQGCRLLSAGHHPDFLELVPLEGSTQIKIEQVRHLSSWVNLSAQLARLKIILVAPIECLNENAANAILKSLEEPPRDTLFILMTHHIHSVKATIRSRCRIIPFQAPDPDSTLTWLNTTLEKDYNPEQISLLSHLHGHAPLEVKEALDNDTLDKLKLWSSQLRYLHQKRPIELIRIYQEWSIEGLSQLLRWTEFWLHGVIKNKLKSERLDAGTDLKPLFSLLDVVSKKRRCLVDTPQVNEQLLFMDLANTWSNHVSG